MEIYELMIIQGFVFEMRSGINECDHRFFLALLEQKKLGLKRDSSPGLCNAEAVLYQLKYRANWEQVVMWVAFNPADVEIGNDNRRICI